MESAWHIDGRGVRVDSTVAMFLPPSSQFEVVRCLAECFASVLLGDRCATQEPTTASSGFSLKVGVSSQQDLSRRLRNICLRILDATLVQSRRYFMLLRFASLALGRGAGLHETTWRQSFPAVVSILQQGCSGCIWEVT